MPAQRYFLLPCFDRTPQFHAHNRHFAILSHIPLQNENFFRHCYYYFALIWWLSPFHQISISRPAKSSYTFTWWFSHSSRPYFAEMAQIMPTYPSLQTLWAMRTTAATPPPTISRLMSASVPQKQPPPGRGTSRRRIGTGRYYQKGRHKDTIRHRPFSRAQIDYRKPPPIFGASMLLLDLARHRRLSKFSTRYWRRGSRAGTHQAEAWRCWWYPFGDIYFGMMSTFHWPIAWNAIDILIFAACEMARRLSPHQPQSAPA